MNKVNEILYLASMLGDLTEHLVLVDHKKEMNILHVRVAESVRNCNNKLFDGYFFYDENYREKDYLKIRDFITNRLRKTVQTGA